MVTNPKELIVIGRAEVLSFPEIGIHDVHARIDTGAQTSAIWVSSAQIVNGRLEVVLLGKGHAGYTGNKIIFEDYSRAMVASSNGQAEARFKVKILVKLAGKKIRATFTLADRSTQVYPVLVGRNILRGKFVVDVKQGTSLREIEKTRSAKLQALLAESGE